MPGLFDMRGVTTEDVQGLIEQQRPALDVTRQYTQRTVPGERARDGVYTNTSDADMELYVLSTQSTTSTSMQAVVNETLPDQAIISSSSNSTGVSHRVALYARVPAGGTYKVRGRDPEFWYEYAKV